MPLAQATSGVSGEMRRQRGGRGAQMLRRHRQQDEVGRAASAMSAVTATARRVGAGQFWIFARGRDLGGSGGLRAHSITSRPARAATSASAVPQAPAPITATD